MGRIDSRIAMRSSANLGESLRSGNAHLTFPVLFSKFWDLRASSSQPDFDSDFCLAGVPLRMTFANYESTFSKPRMDKNKTTNPFGQTTKRCLTAAGGTFQNYESEFPTTNRDFQTTIGGPQPGIFRLRPDQNSCYETKIRMGKE